MARKMYTRDADGNIVLKEQGGSGPVYNIPEPISRIGKIIPQIYQDIKSGEATSEFSPAAKFVGRGIKGAGNVAKKTVEGAGEALMTTLSGILNSLKQERRKGIEVYNPQRKGITKYNMGVDPEPVVGPKPNVSYDPYGEETSGYDDYSGETLGDVNEYDHDTDYSGYTDILEGPIEEVEPINAVEVNEVLNNLVPKSQKQTLDTIVLKGKQRYDALDQAGVFPEIIDWAVNHRRLPGLSSKSDSWFEKIASGEMTPKDYRIIMRALQHSYDTGTGDKSSIDLFKSLIPIYTIKPNA